MEINYKQKNSAFIGKRKKSHIRVSEEKKKN